jgi:hypothetical protein
VLLFGFGGRIGSDPSLGVGFLAHACSGGPNCAQSHPPKRVKSQSALGFCSVKDVRFSSGSASGLLFILDCIVSPETHHSIQEWS